MQVDNDPKHSARATQDILKTKKYIEYAFQLLETKLKVEKPAYKQQVNADALYCIGDGDVFGDIKGFQNSGGQSLQRISIQNAFFLSKPLN